MQYSFVKTSNIESGVVSNDNLSIVLVVFCLECFLRLKLVDNDMVQCVLGTNRTGHEVFYISISF